MMKSPDEIKKGLECCLGDTHAYHCDECPYADDESDVDDGCGDNGIQLLEDSTALIQQLEDHLREATKKIEKLEAERDAAVADITRMVQEPYDPCYCDYCKLTEEECAKSNCRGRNAFVWRGVQKEATNEENPDPV